LDQDLTARMHSLIIYVNIYIYPSFDRVPGNSNGRFI